ncbi:PREDICTED: uncharacterized protein LOC109236152 [Nicotiana attenuata]|uniref:uncharacterized protein LOC109236152 n=1 Tax=Nicotiana attenuata TaxID=49451 RepID=UPI000904868A|nr:PREDICTED: uncharacterized protein LOC109236152 [Nicotiana attenuata]
MAISETKLSMKLLIDTKAGKVLFAEAEKDCVDFLFHILTLPVGTVTKLLKEKGMSGSLTNLYGSVENLKDAYIQSNQCKDILLKPKSSVGIASVPFLLLNDVPTQRTFYGCSNSVRHAKVSDDPCCLSRLWEVYDDKKVNVCCSTGSEGSCRSYKGVCEGDGNIHGYG